MINVTEKVYQGLEAVRMSGQTNMLDRNAVQFLADEMGFHETVIWLHENKKQYAEGVFHGFKVVEEGASDEPAGSVG